MRRKYQYTKISHIKQFKLILDEYEIISHYSSVQNCYYRIYYEIDKSYFIKRSMRT